MNLTLEIGPNLHALGTLLGVMGIVAYLIVQFWIIASVRGGKRG